MDVDVNMNTRTHVNRNMHTYTYMRCKVCLIICRRGWAAGSLGTAPLKSMGPRLAEDLWWHLALEPRRQQDGIGRLKRL